MGGQRPPEADQEQEPCGVHSQHRLRGEQRGKDSGAHGVAGLGVPERSFKKACLKTGPGDFEHAGGLFKRDGVEVEGPLFLKETGRGIVGARRSGNVALKMRVRVPKLLNPET